MLDDKNCQEFSSVVCLGLLERILSILCLDNNLQNDPDHQTQLVRFETLVQQLKETHLNLPDF